MGWAERANATNKKTKLTRLDKADKAADFLGLNLRNRLRAYKIAERVLPRSY